MTLNFIETLTNAIFNECVDKGHNKENDEIAKTTIQNIVFVTTKALMEDLNDLLDEISKSEKQTDATAQYAMACRILLTQYVEKRGIDEFEKEYLAKEDAKTAPSNTTLH